MRSVIINRRIISLNSSKPIKILIQDLINIDNAQFVFEVPESILGEQLELKINGSHGQSYKSPIHFNALINPHSPEISIGPMNWNITSFEISTKLKGSKTIVLSLNRNDAAEWLR